ncbi:lysophospholipase [Gynuella sunshinyii YC6258]|uniref:Lysophospholipase n=1 Tax=Gynuella sunshinyii YC6258 TaxID=1445510 RepID=A0A0C5VPA6_9GAMM|nr:lysophospholipase [Gynuella sunshinyii YC6258]
MNPEAGKEPGYSIIFIIKGELILKLLSIALIAVMSSLLSIRGAAISDDNYQEDWANKVNPFFLKHIQTNYFYSKHSDLYIFYGLIQNTTANSNHRVVVIVPGRKEPFYKYSELAYDLYQYGYSIALIDHRGQGGSERILNDPEKGYVEDFDYYVDDLEQFVDSIVGELSMDKTYLLAQSMGASIGAMLMEKRPDIFNKAVLSSPMMMPNTGKYPAPIAVSLMAVLKLVGKAEEYAPGESGYAVSEFADNTLTSSKERFDMKNDVFESYPEFQLGGVTVNWLYSVMSKSYGFISKYKKVTTPILMLYSNNDKVVMPKYEEKFCDKAKACEPVLFSQSKHEIFMEVDEIRDNALNETLKFLAE